MKKKILILGGSSLISVNIAFFLKKKFDLFLACNSKKPKIKSTKNFFTNFDKYSLNLLIDNIKPEIVIISSANTNIEDCEKNKKKTFLLNFKLVKIVTDLSKKYKFKIIFFSSDQVYKDGIDFSKEKNKLKPLNYYSKTKILAEDYIKKKLKYYLILRTNFFGYGPKYRSSFSDLILSENKKKIKKNYFVDNKFSSIYLPFLVKALEKLITKNVLGIYNLCSPNYMSKYEFAIQLTEEFNLDGKYIKKGFLSNNFKLVKRPLNMSMSNQKLTKKINFKIPKLQKQISIMKKDLNKDYHLFMKKLKIVKK